MSLGKCLERQQKLGLLGGLLAELRGYEPLAVRQQSKFICQQSAVRGCLTQGTQPLKESTAVRFHLARPGRCWTRPPEVPTQKGSDLLRNNLPLPRQG